MSKISENLTPYISMKNHTHDFEDDLVKSRIKGQTPLHTFTGELEKWVAQINIRAIFPCLEISFVQMVDGSYGE